MCWDDRDIADPNIRTPMTLTDKQREELKKYIYDCCMSNMFGDGLEHDYITDGFPAFKGINHMTDDELIEEAGCQSDPDEIERFLKAIELGVEPEDLEEQCFHEGGNFKGGPNGSMICCDCNKPC